MNIKKENTDDLNAVLTVTIEQPDYEERVNHILSDYRKKARLDGFRPGKVPLGLVRKMYHKPVLIEEIHKVLTEAISNYFVQEKLYIIGEPLPHEIDSQPEIDWDKDTEFEFSFDLGLAPEVDTTVTEKQKLPYYKIKVDDEARKNYIDQIRSRFGAFKEADVITGNEMIKADLEEVVSSEGEDRERITVEGGSVYLDYIQDKDIREEFNGKKSGDQLVINLKKALPNEVDLAALLKIEKENLAGVGSDFLITVKTISSFEKAEINQELYDKMFGKDVVTSDEAFQQKVEEDLNRNYEKESDYRFRTDARDYYLANFKQDIPHNFYKRWILHVNEDKMTAEDLEKNYADYVSDLKWQLIKGKIGRDHQLEVSEEELVQFVSGLYRAQFMQYYGVAEIPGEMLSKYAEEALKKDEERRKYQEMIMENKVYDLIKATVKLDTKEVTLEKFKKLYDKQ